MSSFNVGICGPVLIIISIIILVNILNLQNTDEGFNDLINGSNPGLIIMLITGPLMLIAVVFIGFYPKKS
jgi:hypothetical protein